MSCSFATTNDICGPTPYAADKVDIIPLLTCRKNISDYLTNLGCSGSRTNDIPVEYEVILNRAGLHSLSREEKERMTVCPKHRYDLTTHYQKLSSYCSHPSHGSESRKLQNPRRVNKDVADEIYNWFKVSLPIGSGKL